MDPQVQLTDFMGQNLVLLLLALFIIICVFAGVRIVPQSEKYVVERLGRLRAVLGPGINFIVPFLDQVRHKVSILERQLPTMQQDAITSDNVLVQVETSVFYRIIEPEKTVYRIRDVDGAISTTVAGIVRSEVGRMELDQVQSNRSSVIAAVREQLAQQVDDWEETYEVVELGSFVVTDLTLSYRVWQDATLGAFTVRGELRNLFDQDYAYVKGYPMPGRSAFVSLKWEY